MDTRKIAFIQILLTVIIASCNQRPVSNDRELYFAKNELSEDDWSDSISNRYISEDLFLLDEPSLKDTTNRNETLRLTVFPSIIYIPYCIKLERIDSLYRVSIRISSDDKTFRASGLNGLLLTYQSDFESMDTIYQGIRKGLDSLNVFALNNLTPEIIRRNKIQGADGTTYLLEYYVNGKHIALKRWDGFLDKGYYDKSAEFLRTVKRLHGLIPSGVLPELEAAREPADLKFSIFKTKV